MPSGCKIGTRLQEYVNAPVATAAAIRALPTGDFRRTGGAAFVKEDDSSLWVFDEDSALTATDVVLVPDSGSGCWLRSSPVIIRTVTITSDDLTTAGVGPETETIGVVLTNSAVVIGYRINLTDAFDNGSGVSLTLEVGHSNDANAYETGFDCFTGSALEGVGWTFATKGIGIGVPAWDGTAVGQCTAAFTAGADTLANFSNGSVTINIIAVDLPV